MTGEKSSRRSKIDGGTLLGFAALACSMVFGIVLYLAIGVEYVTGEIASSRGALGTWTVEPDSCSTGEGHGFFGVDLLVDDSKRLRVIHSESVGDKLVVYGPEAGAEGIAALASDCSTLHVEVQEQESGTGRVNNVKGSVGFVCTLAGGEVQGAVTFENCH